MEKRGKVVPALSNFSSLCQTNAQSGSDYAFLCFLFSCLLKKPSVCEFLCDSFQLLVHLQNLCARHQKMKFISCAFQEGILRAEDPFVSSLFISSRRHCVRSGRHLIVIWWCALINKKQSFWSKTASCFFFPLSLSLWLKGETSLSLQTERPPSVCVCSWREGILLSAETLLLIRTLTHPNNLLFWWIVCILFTLVGHPAESAS